MKKNKKNPVEILFKDANYAIIELSNGKKIIANVILKSSNSSSRMNIDCSSVETVYGAELILDKLRVMENK